MNLKEAAHRLGVHYQTAYNWVRAGELVAVRVGGRYEISDAAIAQFHATRAALIAEPHPHREGGVPRVTEEDVLAELEAMMSDPLVDSAAVATHTARRGAAVLGDVCLVARMSDDGQTVADLAVEHDEADRAGFIKALLARSGGWPTTKSGGMAAPAYETGECVLIPHVPQDRIRSALPPELRQYLGRYRIHSLLAAPVGPASNPTGFVAFTRDDPTRPYTRADQEFAARFGERIGALFNAAQELELAWNLRRELVDALRVVLRDRPATTPLTGEEIGGIFDARPEFSALPVAIFDGDGRFVYPNDTLLAIGGFERDYLEQQTAESMAHPDHRAEEREMLARLTSGAVDYLDSDGWVDLADGTRIEYVSHRAAVRRADATLACFISVVRPLTTER